MGTAGIILAAGKGTRFGESAVNKTAVKWKGKSLVQRGIENLPKTVDKIFIVVGYKKETVMAAVEAKNACFVEQKRLWGTGYAVKTALNKIKRLPDEPENVLVTNGDHLFMIKNETLERLLEVHRQNGNEATILSTVCRNPEGVDNGRIIKNGNRVVKIVEKSDFDERTRAIKELNSGTYVFKYKAINEVIKKVKRDPGKEIYLTDIIFRLGKIGMATADFTEVGAGVNTKQDLQGIEETY